MIKSTRNSSKLVMLALLITIFAFGCKSRKKTSELNAAAAEKARMEQEASRKKAEEQERKDKEAAAAEQARLDAEARQREAKASTPSVRLSQYFDAISSSGNVASANASIGEALALFESPDTPVLIIISEEAGQKDYDKPTTIKAYLNYLKDQKKNINRIENLQFNSSGRITEMELKK